LITASSGTWRRRVRFGRQGPCANARQHHGRHIGQLHNSRSHPRDGRGSMPLHRPAPHQIYPTAPRPFRCGPLTARLWTEFGANGTKKWLRTLACAELHIADRVDRGAVRDGSIPSEAPRAGETRLAFRYAEISIVSASCGGMHSGHLSRRLLPNRTVGS
jgi:hypothetical protein